MLWACQNPLEADWAGAGVGRKVVAMKKLAAARPVTFLKSTVFMELYTLQGQVLYKGSALSGDKRLRLHNGVAIAAYRNQNGDVKAAKIVEAK